MLGLGLVFDQVSIQYNVLEVAQYCIIKFSRWLIIARYKVWMGLGVKLGLGIGLVVEAGLGVRAGLGLGAKLGLGVGLGSG